jgi:hypothetical protein
LITTITSIKLPEAITINFPHLLFWAPQLFERHELLVVFPALEANGRGPLVPFNSKAT